MSVNFSANQYEKNFHPISLQNWQVPKELGKRPHTRAGSTQIIANDRGHMAPGVPRSRKSPWGPYVGTWDIPCPIPGNRMMNTTARSEGAIEKLQRCKTDGDILLSGALKQCHLPEPLPVKADIEADTDAAQGLGVKAGTPPLLSSDDVTKFDSGIRSGAKNPSPQYPQYPSPNSPCESNSRIIWPKPAEHKRAASGLNEEPSHENIPQTPEMRPVSPHIAPRISPCREPSPVQQITPTVGNEPELANLTNSPNGVAWPMPENPSKS